MDTLQHSADMIYARVGECITSNSKNFDLIQSEKYEAVAIISKHHQHCVRPLGDGRCMRLGRLESTSSAQAHKREKVSLSMEEAVVFTFRVRSTQ